MRRLLPGLALALAACHCGTSGLSRVDRSATVDLEVSLGRPFLGETATAVVTVRSKGRGAVAVQGVRADNPALQLSWEGQPAGTVPPAGRLEITVSWTPTEAGLISGTLSVDLGTDDPAEQHQLAHVAGEARVKPDCDDGNACTDDRFDREAERCEHVNTNNSCDDGNACTEDDRCHEGACRGLARTCDDSNVCTLNLCDPVSGCAFPPDERQCSDSDPCTKDVCDPNAGCSHPSADDGTACGPFSCSMAHVCVFGACRELDITGSSEGFPCSDGDVCTDGDSCHAGQCVPGPMRETGPRVQQLLPTFGGEGAWVATDGYRYLYVDSDRSDNPLGLRVTVWDGTRLTLRGALNLRASAPPITLGPGRFLVPHDQALALVDATNPAQPLVAWDAPIEPVLPAPQSARILQVARMAGGLALLAGAGSSAGSVVAYARLPRLDAPPTLWKTLARHDFIRDLDAQDNVVAWATEERVVWQRLDLAGDVLLAVAVPRTNTTRVSVASSRLAAASASGVDLYEITPGRVPLLCDRYGGCLPLEPGCDGSFPYAPATYQLCSPNALTCPEGTHCETVRAIDSSLDVECGGPTCCDETMDVCFESAGPWWARLGEYAADNVQDVLLRGDEIVIATGTGTASLRPGVASLEAPTFTTIDPMPGESLERADDHVLVRGQVALALRLGSGPPTRVSGAGLGELTALVDGPGALASHVAGGPMTVARVTPMLANNTDDVAYAFDAWRTTTFASDATHVRVLNGATRTALAERNPGAIVTGSGACSALRLDLVSASGESQEAAVCGVEAGWLAAAPNRLWLAGRAASSLISGWTLAPLATNPSETLMHDAPHDRLGLRVSADGRYLAFPAFETTPTGDRLRLFRLDAPEMSWVTYVYVTEPDPLTLPSSSAEFAIEGDRAITVVDGVARLHTVTHATRPFETELPEVPLDAAMVHADARVLGMADNHAWVTLRRTVNGQTRPELVELVYSDDGQSLRLLGGVALPGLATSLFDDGARLLATTPAGVVVLAPGCQLPE